jgi:hypothetical protein
MKTIEISSTTNASMDDQRLLGSVKFKPDHSWFAKHIPSGEDWYIIGIDFKSGEVCAAGWPPSIGKLSDCKDFEINLPLDESELNHRRRKFGVRWA